MNRRYLLSKIRSWKSTNTGRASCSMRTGHVAWPPEVRDMSTFQNRQCSHPFLGGELPELPRLLLFIKLISPFEIITHIILAIKWTLQEVGFEFFKNSYSYSIHHTQKIVLNNTICTRRGKENIIYYNQQSGQIWTDMYNAPSTSAQILNQTTFSGITVLPVQEHSSSLRSGLSESFLLAALLTGK